MYASKSVQRKSPFRHEFADNQSKTFLSLSLEKFAIKVCLYSICHWLSGHFPTANKSILFRLATFSAARNLSLLAPSIGV